MIQQLATSKTVSVYILALHVPTTITSCVLLFCSNEEVVGRVVKSSGIPRKDIFVVTKVCCRVVHSCSSLHPVNICHFHDVALG